jgi:hypothetical protein
MTAEMIPAPSVGDWYAIDTRMALADLECRAHGSMAHDLAPCRCYDDGQERGVWCASVWVGEPRAKVGGCG